MNHCVRLLLLFTPSLVALALLGIAAATNWWTIALERNIPTESSWNTSSKDGPFYSTLVRVPFSSGLLGDCASYRNIKVLLADTFDFRGGLSNEEKIMLENENCTDTQFTCASGVALRPKLTRCIDGEGKCNHIVDCEDKSDETSCPEIEFFNCPTGYVKCHDGKSCYRFNEQTCDGVSNCLDGSDEKGCSLDKCQRNHRFYCRREGQCARRENSKRCDGIVDCADKSDEENCSQCSDNPSNIFCDSKCLPEKYRCDGIVHCSDLSDETNCGSKVLDLQKRDFPNGQACMEHRFHPFRFYPPVLNHSQLEGYSHPSERVEYLHSIFYIRLAFFYGIAGGLIFLLLAVVSLFFFGCCRHQCVSVPFYFHGLWMLLAWLAIVTGLLASVFLWLWQKQTVLDADKSLPLNIEIHERNPTLRHIEFFGLSFWLACGAALASFIGLLLSYCVCCTIGSDRAEDKEYEIMQMHSY